jgi:hypothetical protein
MHSVKICVQRGVPAIQITEQHIHFVISIWPQTHGDELNKWVFRHEPQKKQEY